MMIDEVLTRHQQKRQLEPTPATRHFPPGKRISEARGLLHEADMRQEDLFHPPAIVCQDYSYSGIVAHVRQVNEEMNRNERMNLQRGLAIGRSLIRFREQFCKDHGSYSEGLKEMGLSTQRASEYVRGAEQPLETQASWTSLRDMTNWLVENRQPKSGTPGAGSTPQDESQKPTICTVCRKAGKTVPTSGCKRCEECNAATTKKVKKWQFCRLCKVEKKPDCLTCEELNGRLMTEAETARHFPPREPGDDTEAEAAATKYEEGQLKKVFRSWFQEVKKIAKTYGLKWGDKINDSDPRFKRAFSLHCKARDALRDLLRELSSQPSPEIPA